jgi:hypothetical protein
MGTFLGYKWISDRTGISPVQSFSVQSELGTRRRTVVAGETRHETYPASQRPEPTIPAHLTFAFKHEIVHLEFLVRLFDVLDPAILEGWIRSEPSGAYARRAGFFHEWLTGKTLNVPGAPSGNYVDALDSGKYLVASRTVNVQRWRVRDNLPGSRAFCPIIVRSESVQ